MADPEGNAFYPVLDGLKDGEEVVTAGAFLIDAETRLNPAAGSIYYGGSSGKGSSATVAVRPSTPEEEDARAQKAKTALAKLGAQDRKLAQAQKYCPIQQVTLLGEMGKPYKITLDGQPVFLCCSSCEEKARADPKGTLATVKRLKARVAGPAVKPPAPKSSSWTSEKQAKIEAALNELTAADRQLAQAQKYCPIGGEPLGSMGKPIKLTLQGQTVFLCCSGCENAARADEKGTLAKVGQLKAKAAKSKP
jgi:hypothetical protein